MGWEMRGRWGPYYTISRRENGRVMREYVGKGPGAEQLAALREARAWADFLVRLEQKREREKLRERSDAEAALIELRALLKEAAREALEAAGYHQHKRGEWRQKRGKKTEGAAGAGPHRKRTAGPGPER